MSDFDKSFGETQAAWRLSHITDRRQGEHNGLSRRWILPPELWKEGLWPGIRGSLPAYVDRAGARVQKHVGAHNLKSSWMLCANLYFPFREASGLPILAGFLRTHVSPDILSVDRVELEYAEAPPLDPQSLLGESEGGKRGASQTSPDVAFILRTAGGSGLVLTESKLAEHSFYGCSGRKPKAENPDAGRCMDWPTLQEDIPGRCWQMQWEEGKRKQKNRKYWEHIQLSAHGKRVLTRCPAATAGYQLFRQQALAEAIAASGKYDLVASCVAYDARNTDLVRSLRSTGVNDFATGWGSLLDGRARFATWTHQQWVSWVKASDGGHWRDWLSYVETRYGYGEATS